VIIDRFALNEDFINEHNLLWIDGLTSSSGQDLAKPKKGKIHLYVQSFIEQYGERKCEANSMILHKEASRDLYEKSILKYFDVRAYDQWEKNQREIRNFIATEAETRFNELLGAA